MSIVILLMSIIQSYSTVLAVFSFKIFTELQSWPNNKYAQFFFFFSDLHDKFCQNFSLTAVF